MATLAQQESTATTEKSIIALEERVAALEAEVAQLKAQQATATPEDATLWWKKLVGIYAKAAEEFEQLRQMRFRIGTMDLKIAAIALANDATVLTRNLQEFGKIPGLRVENWSV